MELLSTYLTLRLSALQVLPYSRITLPPWAAKMPNQNPLVSNGWSSFSFGVRTTGVAKGKSTCNEEEAEEEEKKKVQNTHTRRNKVRRGGAPSSKRHIPFRLPEQQMEKFSTLKYNHLGKKFPHVKFHISPLHLSRAEQCTIKTIKHQTTLTHPGCRPRSMSTGEDTPPGKMFWGDRTPLCLLS